MKSLLAATLATIALTAAATLATPVEAAPLELECNLYPVDRYGQATPTPFNDAVKLCVSFHLGVREEQVTILATDNEEDTALVSVVLSDSVATIIVRDMEVSR